MRQLMKGVVLWHNSSFVILATALLGLVCQRPSDAAYFAYAQYREVVTATGSGGTSASGTWANSSNGGASAIYEATHHRRYEWQGGGSPTPTNIGYSVQASASENFHALGSAEGEAQAGTKDAYASTVFGPASDSDSGSLSISDLDITLQGFSGSSASSYPSQTTNSTAGVTWNNP
jgi:hypothetical protein